MTTLQEAAKLAIEALTYCEALNSSMIEQKRAALNALRAALAQQGERKNCPQPEICGSKECEFCRDTAAPQAQQPVAFFPPLPRSVLRCAQTVVYDAMQMRQYAMRFTELLAAAPAPQPAQDVPEVGFGNMPTKFLANGTRFKLSFDTLGRVSSLWNFMDELDGRWVALVAAEDDCHLQSAQLVTQPLAKTCDTCAHYQQGKHPGVSIHDETCYECRSYWGNKWEAKSD